MGKIIDIHEERIRPLQLDEICLALKNGGTLLYPTDTIYGLGCNAFNEAAVKKIFAIKGRPETKPMLLLADSITMIEELAEEIPPIAKILLQQFSPGPLTIVFKASKQLSPLVTANTGTIGIRIPSSQFCLDIVKASGVPLISTSANISGQDVPETIGALQKLFSEQVDVFINAGTLPPSLPSTIVDVTGGGVRILREGVIGREQLSSYL